MKRSEELQVIITKGIGPHGFLPTVTPEEEATAARATNERMDATIALRELLVIADTFGFPEQWETERSDFVARRTAELDDAEARIKAERAKL